jgi:predicted dinucleotide-binding enzyme
MKIGIIGAGHIGKALAKHLSKAGYETILSNSRGPQSLTSVVKEIGHGLKAGTVSEAASQDIVFLALPWVKLQEALSGIADWNNRIVVDATNPILPGFVMADLGDKTSSEIVSDWVPGAKLVKAFNTILAAILNTSPQEAGGNRVVFYSGNHDDAKKTVLEIINRSGFAGVDLGKLNEGGKLQQFPGGPLPTLNLIKLN